MLTVILPIQKEYKKDNSHCYPSSDSDITNYNIEEKNDKQNKSNNNQHTVSIHEYNDENMYVSVFKHNFL